MPHCINSIIFTVSVVELSQMLCNRAVAYITRPAVLGSMPSLLARSGFTAGAGQINDAWFSDIKFE